MNRKSIEAVSFFSLSVPREFDGKRLDTFLGSSLEEFSRSYLKKLINNGCIKLNSVLPKPSKTVRHSDIVDITIPEPETISAEPEAIPLDVLFEDSDIIVINKSPGIVVHPAHGHPSGTLVNALLHHCRGSLSTINGVIRPGIVHRLDMWTSGVLVCAKSDNAHKYLAKQFKDRTIAKKYVALVHGAFPDNIGEISAPLGRHWSDFRKMAVRLDVGREAITRVIGVSHRGNYSIVHVRLLTGRTHQIRVHLRNAGHAILCDTVYGKEERFPTHEPVLKRCALHSYFLGFIHPISRKPVQFIAPLPDDLRRAMEFIRDNKE